MNRNKLPFLSRVLVTVSITLFLFNGVSWAEPGLRAMSMGGAFVSLADDAEATYWNPAALGLQLRPEIDYNLLLRAQNEVGCDHWISYVYPIQHYRDIDWGVTGISFMSNVDKGMVDYDSVISLDSELTSRRYMFSYGRKLWWENLALGFNLNCNTYHSELSKSASINGISYSAGASDDDSCFSFDLAAYFRREKFSLGLLLQDVNEPEISLYGTDIHYDLKVSPGFTYFPNEKTNCSIEVYDFLNSNQIRLGGEYFLLPNLPVRVGIYNLNKKENRALTFGCGLNSGEIFAYARIEIDYTLLYWTDNPSEEDDFSHFLGAKIKF